MEFASPGTIVQQRIIEYSPWYAWCNVNKSWRRATQEHAERERKRNGGMPDINFTCRYYKDATDLLGGQHFITDGFQILGRRTGIIPARLRLKWIHHRMEKRSVLLRMWVLDNMELEVGARERKLARWFWFRYSGT
jgi:hypothetical protein